MIEEKTKTNEIPPLDEEVETPAFEEYIKSYSKNKNHPLKIILGFFKGSYWNICKAAVALGAKESVNWVLPICIAGIVDVASKPSEYKLEQIFVYVAVAMFFLLLNVVSMYTFARIFYRVLRRIEGSLRGILIRKLQQLSISYHKEIQSGKLQSKIMRDVENVELLIQQASMSIFAIVLNVSVAIGITLYRSPMVFLFFLCAVPATVITVYIFRKPMKDRNREFREEMEGTQASVAEMLELIPVTRAHGLQWVEVRKMSSRLNQIMNKGYRLDTINSLFGAVSWAVFQGFEILCLGFTGYLAYKGEISVGDVVLYQSYFTQIVSQISNFVNLYPNIARGIESVNSIGEIIRANDVEANNKIIPLQNMTGKVEFRNVYYQYKPGERWIMNDFNLQVRAGESIAFVGDSGAGKSTILNLLIGFAQPQQGRILIDGINMVNLDMNEYRSQIAVVPQNTILFSGTIRSNIAYGIEHISDEEINQVIRDVGLEDLIDTLPDGIYSVLGEHGGNLSGGQRQRISIARAMVRKPKIIIFDEATSALDSISEKKVQAATAKMMENCTTFLVAHRLSTIKDADRIVVVEQGHVVETGSYEELMEKKGKFYELKKMQE